MTRTTWLEQGIRLEPGSGSVRVKLVSSFNTVRCRWTVHLYRKSCFKTDNHETGFRRTEPELEDPQSTFAFCLVWSGPRERERFLLLNRAGSLPNEGIILRGTGGSQLCHAPLDSANDSTTNRGSEKVASSSGAGTAGGRRFGLGRGARPNRPFSCLDLYHTPPDLGERQRHQSHPTQCNQMVLESQSPHKVVNLWYWLEILDNKLTILWGNWLSKTYW